MRKINLNFIRKPSRNQILASYRLSADKIPAEQITVNLMTAASGGGDATIQNQQPSRRLFFRSWRSPVSADKYTRKITNR
jgi:hypothetical protein